MYESILDHQWKNSPQSDDIGDKRQGDISVCLVRIEDHQNDRWPATAAFFQSGEIM